VEVLLLGTGAADGIPNPFCRCDTCTDHRDRGELRTPTSVLIDGRLLIDPGPEAPRQVSRYGRDLTGLVAVLAGHAHSDHLDPALLMHHSWVTEAPLEVVGPEPVIAWSRQWLDGDQAAISFRSVTAGDATDVAGYRVTVLAANHEAFGEACCYLIEDDSASILYATDTGLLPSSTLATLAGRHADLVLLEETFGSRTDKGDRHLHLATFAHTVVRLRELGVVTERTRVVAVHLAHDNPPLAQLGAELAEFGAEVLPDGTVITLG
jgi:adenosylcobinamide kinase/adenosylcobinamide-phosphate guanylyltransferase